MRASWRQAESFVVVDTETGGFSPRRDAVMQIAAVYYVGGRSHDSFETLVKPARGLRVTERAVAVHGIQLERAMDEGLEEAEAFRRLQAFYEKNTGCRKDKEKRPWTIGQNVKFDIDFLYQVGERVRTPLWYFVDPAKVLDVLQFYRSAQYVGLAPSGSGKLEVMAKGLGVPVVKLHDALEDCRATAAVFLELRRRFLHRIENGG